MRISQILGEGRPTVSFEFFPPKTDVGRDSLLRVIGKLAVVSPDFVSVTYGAGGSTRALGIELCREIKRNIEGEVMAHLTCVCHSCEEIEDIADQLWQSNIINIMALRGDRPKGADSPEAFRGFRFANDIMSFLKARHDFCLGGACYPEGHKETPDVQLGIEHLKGKISSGCEFLVTQMFFENESYFRFRDLLHSAGIDVPVIPGIMPITGFSQLDKFENQFGVRLPAGLREAVQEHEDDEAVIEQIGIDWSAAQCRALLNEGAPGIHFYTLNKSSSTVKVCAQMGLMHSAPAVPHPNDL